MLTDDQANDVWEGKLSAEVRSLYFGDLASLFSLRKRWITGISFFLSSGAAASLIGKAPIWVPTACSVIVAMITAYAVAWNLDAKMRTMAKLHSTWAQIANEYGRLWNHSWDDDAEAEFADLKRREVEISELATIEAPNDPKRLERWEDRVIKLYRLENA